MVGAWRAGNADKVRLGDDFVTSHLSSHSRSTCQAPTSALNVVALRRGERYVLFDSSHVLRMRNCDGPLLTTLMISFRNCRAVLATHDLDQSLLLQLPPGPRACTTT